MGYQFLCQLSADSAHAVQANARTHAHKRTRAKTHSEPGGDVTIVYICSFKGQILIEIHYKQLSQITEEISRTYRNVNIIVPLYQIERHTQGFNTGKAWTLTSSVGVL